MKRSAIHPMPQFFDRYIRLVEDINVTEALEKYSALENSLNADDLRRLGDKRYAPGKWTIKDVLQHIIDNERVQSYRALRFARNDKNMLPGYDENLFADEANAGKRETNDLLDEFSTVRKGNIMLFKTFTDDMLQRQGVCNQVSISVLALGFVLTGHQLHHIRIIKERYLPLLGHNF